MRKRSCVTEVIIHVEIDIHACLWKSYKIQTNWMNFGFSDMYMPHLIEKKMKILTTENQSLPLLYKRMNYFQKPTFKIISYNVLIKCVGGTMLGGD